MFGEDFMDGECNGFCIYDREYDYEYDEEYSGYAPRRTVDGILLFRVK